MFRRLLNREGLEGFPEGGQDYVGGEQHGPLLSERQLPKSASSFLG